MLDLTNSVPLEKNASYGFPIKLDRFYDLKKAGIYTIRFKYAPTSSTYPGNIAEDSRWINKVFSNTMTIEIK